MLVLNWPVVLMSTVVLYGLIIVTLPFNALYATIFLFTLIGFWSRLPGSGVNDPTWILYCLDLIDIFALVIAINLGSIPAIIYVCIANTLPRLAGIFPPWQTVLYDSFSMSVALIFVPWIHGITQDIFMSMMIFTAIRIVVCMPLSYIFYPRSFIVWITSWITAIVGVYIANGFYAKVFGGHFDKLMEKGATFDWLLFFIATMVILMFAITVFGFSPKKTGKKIIKVVRKVKRRSKSKEVRIDDMDGMRKIKEQLDKK